MSHPDPTIQRAPVTTARWRASSVLAIVWIAVAAPSPPHSPRPLASATGSYAPQGPGIIRYRKLSPRDFRAAQPPDSVARHAFAIGAYTCVRLVPELPQRVVIEAAEASGTYFATMPEAAFYAEMDPTCSWWNPKARHGRYLLDHEQTHFALVEIEARRLTIEVRQIRVRVQSLGSAAAILRQRISRRVEAAVAQVRILAEQLDGETVDRYAPERQAAWLARVEETLHDLSRPEVDRDSSSSPPASPTDHGS